MPESLSATRPGCSSGFDLLSFPLLRRALLAPWFPYMFQALLLFAFVALAVMGAGQRAPEGVPSKLFARTNLVTLLVWGLWWPAMVWVAVWFGRVWCMVCPMELVANVSERLGRRLGLPQGRLKGWLAGGGLIALFYIAIQMCIAGFELHRSPAFTSIFLWTLLGLAILTGLVLKDRAFCRGFCPVGLLLNVYGRGGMLAVRAKAASPCGDCAGRDCKAGRNRLALDSRSCPSLLNPSTLDSNADCLYCGQCFKSCRPDNLALWLRRWFAASDRRPVLASWPVTLFVMVVSGFVTYELFSEWKTAQAVFLRPVEGVIAWLGAGQGAAGWCKGAYVLVVVPVMLWLLLGGLTRVLGGARSLGEAWRRLALPLAVVISAGHMAKGLAKVVSWGGFLPGAIQEPAGTQTALALAGKILTQPENWLGLRTVAVVGLLLLVTAVWFGMREARLADEAGRAQRGVAVLLLGAFYMFLVAGWGWQ